MGRFEQLYFDDFFRHVDKWQQEVFAFPRENKKLLVVFYSPILLKNAIIKMIQITGLLMKFLRMPLPGS